MEDDNGIEFTDCFSFRGFLEMDEIPEPYEPIPQDEDPDLWDAINATDND